MADHEEFEREHKHAIAPEKNAGDSAESGAEVLAVITSLMRDESLLNAQAERMREEALKLDEVGDDEAKALAGQMLRQAEQVTMLAQEVGQTRKEIQADPHKKGARTKRDALLVRTSVILEASEQEEGAAAGANEHNAEHKHVMRDAKHAIAKKEEPKHAAAKPKKSTMKQKMVAVATQCFAMEKKAEANVVHYWQAAGEKAEEAYSFVVEKAAVVGVFAKQAWHKASDVCSTGIDAMLHPIESAKKMAGHVANAASTLTQNTKNLFHRASSAIMNMWPFGDDEKEEAPLAVAPPKPPLNKKAMQAAKNVPMPLCMKAPAHHEAGEAVHPLATPFTQPFGPLLSFS